MFSMDDFDENVKFDINMEDDGMADFTNVLMSITHVLKTIDHDNITKSGQDLMMKVFNMTGLDATVENEQVLNVVMSLITHIFASLTTHPDRNEYFKYFDEIVMYPLLNKENE